MYYALFVLSLFAMAGVEQDQNRPENQQRLASWLHVPFFIAGITFMLLGVAGMINGL